MALTLFIVVGRGPTANPTKTTLNSTDGSRNARVASCSGDAGCLTMAVSNNKPGNLKTKQGEGKCQS